MESRAGFRMEENCARRHSQHGYRRVRYCTLLYTFFTPFCATHRMVARVAVRASWEIMNRSTLFSLLSLEYPHLPLPYPACASWRWQPHPDTNTGADFRCLHLGHGVFLISGGGTRVTGRFCVFFLIFNSVLEGTPFPGSQDRRI